MSRAPRAQRRNRLREERKKPLPIAVGEDRAKRTTWWTFPKAIASFISAVLALYAVYLIIYETIPDVQPTASDPQSPFTFPFYVKNNSKLFDMSSAAWACKVLSMVDERGNTIQNVSAIQRGTSVIRKGQRINYNCNVVRTNARIVRLRIEIEMLYETDFYLFQQQRLLAPRIFTWIADTGAPQWIEGDVR